MSLMAQDCQSQERVRRASGTHENKPAPVVLVDRSVRPDDQAEWHIVHPVSCPKPSNKARHLKALRC